jgi:hypothetical protein
MVIQRNRQRGRHTVNHVSGDTDDESTKQIHGYGCPAADLRWINSNTYVNEHNSVNESKTYFEIDVVLSRALLLFTQEFIDPQKA